MCLFCVCYIRLSRCTHIRERLYASSARGIYSSPATYACASVFKYEPLVQSRYIRATLTRTVYALNSISASCARGIRYYYKLTKWTHGRQRSAYARAYNFSVQRGIRAPDDPAVYAEPCVRRLRTRQQSYNLKNTRETQRAAYRRNLKFFRCRRRIRAAGETVVYAWPYVRKMQLALTYVRTGVSAQYLYNIFFSLMQ